MPKVRFRYSTIEKGYCTKKTCPLYSYCLTQKTRKLYM